MYADVHEVQDTQDLETAPARRARNATRRPAGRRPQWEGLEPRQLLSATIDLRLPGGGKTVAVTGVGQVITMELWATVQGSDATGADDGFQSLAGSLVSTKLAGGASVAGNLNAAAVLPFNAGGSQPGAHTDLNGDGSTDIGPANPDDSSGYFSVRAGSMVTSGTVQGATNSFKLATVTYTVTSLGSRGQTSINFVPRTSGPGTLWSEDGVNKISFGTPVPVGTPVVLNGSGGGGTGGGVTHHGSISGTVFRDANGDGIRQSNEGGIAGVKLFIDANKNGILDAGELVTKTGADGKYAFTGLAAGTYRVRQVTPAGYTPTNPKSGFLDVKVSTNTSAVSGKLFADKPTKASAIVSSAR